MKPHKALQYFRVAQSFAEMSKDPSTKVGCVLLAEESNHVLSAGFNGFPSEFHISGRQDGDASKQEYLCGDLIPVCRML